MIVESRHLKTYPIFLQYRTKVKIDINQLSATNINQIYHRKNS